MIVKLITKKSIVIGYQTKPIPENAITYDLDTENIFCGYSYIDANGNFVSNKEAYEADLKASAEKNALAVLRDKRELLLLAFDKWEKAVLRGREEDSSIIMNWYQDLLDLKESAFDEIPDAVKYYL